MRALLLLLLLFAIALPGEATAHAALLATEPADGAVLEHLPPSFTLTFNEPVSPTALTMIGPAGQSLPLAAATLAGDAVTVPAPAVTATGTYALSWRVISSDGHPVGGTVVISVGAASRPGTAARPEAIDWPVAVGVWLSRVLTYAGLFVGVGGAFFLAWTGTGRRRWLDAVLAAGLVALPVDVGLAGLDALDRPARALLSAEVWQAGLQPGFALFVGAAAAAMLLALLAVRRCGATAMLLALPALGLVGVALAATGHAATAEPQWAMRPAVFLHGVAVAFWIGALLPLAGLFRSEAPGAAFALRRFSVVIPAAVAVLLASGLLLAVVQVGAPEELVGTAYGGVLLVKLALVAAVLGLAAYNRWRLTAPALAGAAPDKRRLARIIAVEFCLTLLVLGVVGLWRFTPPPRALLAAAPPAAMSVHGADGMLNLTLTPGRAGEVAAEIRLTGMDLAPLPARQVTLELGNRDLGIEPIERAARPDGSGSWRVDQLALPAAGTWQAEVDVLVSDFQQFRLAGEIAVRP